MISVYSRPNGRIIQESTTQIKSDADRIVASDMTRIETSPKQSKLLKKKITHCKFNLMDKYSIAQDLIIHGFHLYKIK